jgi:uncharacterized membrane protein
VGFPNFPNMPPPMGVWSQPDPGHIPLRALTVGDLLGAGLGVVWRHITLLAPIAVAIAALSSAVELVILQTTGALTGVASGTWVDDLLRGLNTGDAGLLPTGIYVSTAASSLITVAGTLFVTAIVAACVGADAVSRTARPGAVTNRLRGGLGAAAVVSVLAAVAIVIGSFLILVPGLLAFMVWSLATPAAMMERARPGAALARSARLSRGHRWRILGVTVLIVVITVAIESVLSSVVVGLLPGLSAAAALIVGDAVAAVVSAITLPWVGAVIALLYVDIRIRTENLGPALRAHAAGLAQT